MNLSELKAKILANPFYQKYDSFMVLGVVGIIGAVIVILVTIPQLFRLFETFKNIAELEQKKAFLVEKVGILEGVNQDEYQNQLDATLVALPTDKDITGMVGQVLTVLSSSGMSLNGLAVSASPNESDKVQQVILRVDLSGSQEGLAGFLENLRSTPRLIKLTKVEIGSSRNNQLAISVELMGLYQSLPEEINAIDQPVPQLEQDEKDVLADIEAKIRDFPQEAVSGPVPVEGKLNPFAP